MNSQITRSFINNFNNLPSRIKIAARKNYKIWKENPQHPSLNFKQIKFASNIHSVRIGIGWRALGVMNGENMIWFWIGSHSDYDKLLK